MDKMMPIKWLREESKEYIYSLHTNMSISLLILSNFSCKNMYHYICHLYTIYIYIYIYINPMI